MTFSRDRVASEYESMYGRMLWSEETRKNYRDLAFDRQNRVLNAMRHQPIHWEPRVVQMKNINAEPLNSRHVSSPRKDYSREEEMKSNDDQLQKSYSTVEIDKRRKGSQNSNKNYENSLKSCPNLSPQTATDSSNSSNQESREWLVHIDFDPDKRADKDVHTIKVTTTMINPEITGTSSPGKDKKAQSSKEKSRSSSPLPDNKQKSSSKTSPGTHQISQETEKPEEKSSPQMSEEDKRSLMLNRLLRPMMRSVPPVTPKPNIHHQVAKSRTPVVAWEKTQTVPPSSAANKSIQTDANKIQIARKNPPFAMYGVNDNGIRQTYNVRPNSREVHSSALRAKKERERLQIYRREVEKKNPPMVKQPQVSMKGFCEALCAQNKPREPDAWSTEYKRNFTSCYDFTPKRPVFKPIREFNKPLAVSK